MSYEFECQRMETLSPAERLAEVEKLRAELVKALQSGRDGAAYALHIEFDRINSAAQWLNFNEESKAHGRTIPDDFPPELPPGASIAYGEHRGKRFDDTARLVVASHPPWPGSPPCTYKNYKGTIDGKEAWAPANYINWKGLAP